MNKSTIIAEQQRLQSLYDEARARGDRDVAVAASAELSAFITQHNPPKVRGFASRAGQRQNREMRARMHAHHKR